MPARVQPPSPRTSRRHSHTRQYTRRSRCATAANPQPHRFHTVLSTAGSSTQATSSASGTAKRRPSSLLSWPTQPCNPFFHRKAVQQTKSAAVLPPFAPPVPSSTSAGSCEILVSCATPRAFFDHPCSRTSYRHCLRSHWTRGDITPPPTDGSPRTHSADRAIRRARRRGCGSGTASHVACSIGCKGLRSHPVPHSIPTLQPGKGRREVPRQGPRFPGAGCAHPPTHPSPLRPSLWSDRLYLPGPSPIRTAPLP